MTFIPFRNRAKLAILHRRVSVRTTYTNYTKSLAALAFAAMAALLTGCGAGGTPADTTPPDTGPTAALLTLSATPATVPSDNSATTTVTVTALSATNAAVPGVVVTLGTDTGVISAQTVTTGSDGTATFTFRSGVTSLANRTATVTASAGATAQIQIEIAGSTLSVFSTTGSSVPNDGTSPVDITFIAKNAQGVGLADTPFTASWVTTSGGQLTLTPTSGVTDVDGKFVIRVAGVTGTTGTATVSASAAGSTASAPINVTPVAGTFAISKTTNSTGNVIILNPTSVPMTIADQLTVTVAAPAPIADVTFTALQGSWVGATPDPHTLVVPVVGGVAEAILTQSGAGQDNVEVRDATNSATNDSLVVGVTAVTPYSLTLTASPTVVAKTTATSSGTSTLTATVRDANGQPVGNAAVAFSMSNTTGGGESVSPVVAYTATVAGGGLGLGEAAATFTSGSLSSSATGVQIRATVQGTTVATEANLPTPVDVTPSDNDAAIVIGGTAGSIAFGISTAIEALSTTTYQLPMTVLVSDSYGNPAPNTTVNLSVWPVAWSTRTGTPCTVDPDTATTGTFYGEDKNENLLMDSGEDGYRKHWASGTVVAGGTLDGNLTPVNSDGGNVPSSVITDANGLANFELTYLKNRALWTIVRMRATAVVQGTESVSEHTFRLPAAEADAGTNCYIDSQYSF